jgi:hypothetical protein
LPNLPRRGLLSSSTRDGRYDEANLVEVGGVMAEMHRDHRATRFGGGDRVRDV